jgi:hypothetical protein
MDTIFDLPAHPLFSHFPIALAPAIVLAAAAMVARPAWRTSLGPVVVGASVLTLVAILLARRSGEELFELLQQEPSIGRHEELADQSLVLWAVFVAVTAALVVLHRRSARPAPGEPAPGVATGARARTAVNVLAALCVIVGVTSTVWIARTGHEGAKSHWSFVSDN